MNKICLTKKFTTETSHRLLDYPGDCSNIHGHTYQWEVSVRGDVGENGMVIDFKTLKQLCQYAIVDHFDHSIVLSKDDFFAELLIQLKKPIRLKELDENPTAENMIFFSLASFISMLRDRSDTKNISHVRIRLWETKDSYATSGWVDINLGGGPE